MSKKDKKKRKRQSSRDTHTRMSLGARRLREYFESAIPLVRLDPWAVFGPKDPIEIHPPGGGEPFAVSLFDDDEECGFVVFEADPSNSALARALDADGEEGGGVGALLLRLGDMTPSGREFVRSTGIKVTRDSLLLMPISSEGEGPPSPSIQRRLTEAARAVLAATQLVDDPGDTDSMPNPNMVSVQFDADGAARAEFVPWPDDLPEPGGDEPDFDFLPLDDDLFEAGRAGLQGEPLVPGRGWTIGLASFPYRSAQSSASQILFVADADDLGFYHNTGAEGDMTEPLVQALISLVAGEHENHWVSSDGTVSVEWPGGRPEFISLDDDELADVLRPLCEATGIDLRLLDEPVIEPYFSNSVQAATLTSIAESSDTDEEAEAAKSSAFAAACRGAVRWVGYRILQRGDELAPELERIAAAVHAAGIVFHECRLAAATFAAAELSPGADWTERVGLGPAPPNLREILAEIADLEPCLWHIVDCSPTSVTYIDVVTGERHEMPWYDGDEWRAKLDLVLTLRVRGEAIFAVARDRTRAEADAVLDEVRKRRGSVDAQALKAEALLLTSGC